MKKGITYFEEAIAEDLSYGPGVRRTVRLLWNAGKHWERQIITGGGYNESRIGCAKGIGNRPVTCRSPLLACQYQICLPMGLVRRWTRIQTSDKSESELCNSLSLVFPLFGGDGTAEWSTRRRKKSSKIRSLPTGHKHAGRNGFLLYAPVRLCNRPVS